jgi:hypothetical protein
MWSHHAYLTGEIDIRRMVMVGDTAASMREPVLGA